MAMICCCFSYLSGRILFHQTKATSNTVLRHMCTKLEGFISNGLHKVTHELEINILLVRPFLLESKVVMYGLECL